MSMSVHKNTLKSYKVNLNFLKSNQTKNRIVFISRELIKNHSHTSGMLYISQSFEGRVQSMKMKITFGPLNVKPNLAEIRNQEMQISLDLHTVYSPHSPFNFYGASNPAKLFCTLFQTFFHICCDTFAKVHSRFEFLSIMISVVTIHCGKSQGIRWNSIHFQTQMNILRELFDVL